MNKVTAVVLTKNEEEVIARCLSSLDWCDELLVIDDNSFDETSKIARKYGAKVVEHKLNNNFAQQRNFGLKIARNDWVLFVDADEVVTVKLKASIKKAIVQTGVKAFSVVRLNYYYNKLLSFHEKSDTKLVRLVNRIDGKWTRKVHEYWLTDQSIGKLNGYLIHMIPTSIEKFVAKINFYRKIHSTEINKEGKKVYFLKVIVWPIAKFLKKYIIEGGYKDGSRGFIFSMLMSFHSFLSWSELWLHKR